MERGEFDELGRETGRRCNGTGEKRCRKEGFCEDLELGD